jgi:peptide/nickel transport system substrate-binding protein
VRWWSSAFGAAAAAVLTLSCVAQPQVTPAATEAMPTTVEAPRPGGRVVTGGFTDIATLQPILATDAPSVGVISSIYSQILRPDPANGEPAPHLATFEQSANGLSYTFEVQAKANWSDGKPIVATDWYVTTKLFAMSKRTLGKSSYQDVVGWKEFVEGTATEISGVRLDPTHPKKFTVTLGSVLCGALFDLSNHVLPAHVFGKYAEPGQGDAIDRAPENTAPTVFSGPFKFKEWRPGDQIILTRNDMYWKGAPFIEEWVRKVVADANATVAQLKTGEINFAGIEPKDLADIERQPYLRVHKAPTPGYTFIGWRTDSQSAPALQDKRVRQALAYGLNVDAVIKTVLFGEGTKQVAHHVPVQWAYPDAKFLNPYPYDRAKAESLLQEAGYARGADGTYAKDGKPISFTIRTNAGNKTRETLAQVASEQYKAIGIDAKSKLEAFQGLVTQLTEGHPTVEAVIIGWGLGPEPDPYGIWHSSQIPDPATKRTGLGFTFFKSAELDKAIEQGRNPTDGDCSIAARKKHYEIFNRILNEEQPYNFGFSTVNIAVTSADIQNIRPQPFGGLAHNVHEWWFRGSE